MELRQYAQIVWKWLWLIVLGTVLAGGTAYVVSKRMTPIYRATTTLLINEQRNPAVLDWTALQTSERLARTYAERFTKRPVLEEVARELGLGWEESQEFPADISVQPIRDTQLLELSVEHTDPELAAAIANTLPQVFIKRNEEQQLARFASSKQNLAAQMEAIQADILATQAAIDEVKDSDDPEDQAKLSQLQVSLAQYQNSYASLLKSYEEIRLAEAQALDNIIVDEPAVVPQYPVKPRTRLNTLLAAVVGAMLATGVAFLIEYLDDTVKTSEDVEQVLGVPALGAIGRLRPKEVREGLITALQPRSPISEGYRTLRTNIQFSTVDRPLRTLLVTSAGPAEGKTTTAANLGVVMAQAGLKVIVVDSDLRRPALHRMLGVSNSRGLSTSLLEENPSLDGTLQATGVENLWVLTSGPLPPNPSELLGSERMARLMERLKEKADVVVFDSPPALAVTDAAVLAREVDGVLMVVDAGATRREVVVRARETLARVGANILGAALNKLSPKGTSGYYYYYYTSGDGREGRRRPEGAHAEGQGLLRRWLERVWPGREV